MSWTAEEARYALDRLIARRKIRPAEVERALRDRKNEIREIQQRLAELESLGGKRPLVRRAATRHRRAKRSRRKLSAKARSQLKVQGQYMGYVRRLNAAQKAQVRKVRQAKGWRAAIAAAKKVAIRQGQRQRGQ